jgi:hypothetical protein
MDAFQFLADRNPFTIDRATWIYKLMTMEDHKGPESLEGLAGFYLFAIRMERESQGFNAQHAIRATFAHDLNDAKHTTALPRSSSYREIWIAENL